jgi:prepilin-type N-terminal cleavage/methylation domain-containing protein
MYKRPKTMPLRTPNAESQAAFTLIEMIAALFILGILAASAAPTFTDSLMYHRVESAALRLKNDLHLARKSAITTSAECSLEFVTGTSYTLSNMDSLDHSGQPYTVDLNHPPYGVQVTSVDFGGASVVRFNGYGLPSCSGSATLQAGNHRRQIAFDNQGNVTITAP